MMDVLGAVYREKCSSGRNSKTEKRLYFQEVKSRKIKRKPSLGESPNAETTGGESPSFFSTIST